MKAGRDPVRLEVFQHLFAALAEEMGVSLMRSAFSPNIKERRDFSCALFDSDGRTIAQAAHLPVHLGAAPMSLAAARAAIDMEPGDAVLLNDPYQGGSHLPDLTLVSPVFLPGSSEADFYCLNRAHHADVGGAFPGSMAPAADVHGEGLRIPPVRWIRAGQPDPDLARIVLANMRVPADRRGDLLAQWAANQVGERRLQAMASEHGSVQLRERSSQLMDWTESLMRSALSEMPAGSWSFEDEVGGGPGEKEEALMIRLRLTARAGRLTLDFRASDPQGSGSVNTVRAVTRSAVFYVLRLLLPPGTPTNDGVMRCVTVLTTPGTVLDASYPAPVAAGNVETSQRVVDVILGALAQAVPDRIPAASAGTMSNLTFGGVDRQARPFAYYETLAGGAGGGPAGHGAHALQTHMTNTRNTPVEDMETSWPVRVTGLSVRRGSGGAGAGRGGDGIVKRLRFLEPVRLGWIAERQVLGPWGLGGGERGRAGCARWRRSPEARWQKLGSKVGIDLPRGAEIEVSTPGGGGFGPT
ncbi:MAG: N-methylhydantoinase B [Chlamydiales bacterium]|jgi:N-methylhydantoinase B